MTDLSSASLDVRCDKLLLGRLGHELGLIYHDTLQAPLPAGIQALIDRLDRSVSASTGSRRDESSRR